MSTCTQCRKEFDRSFHWQTRCPACLGASQQIGGPIPIPHSNGSSGGGIAEPVSAMVPHAPFGPGGPAGHCAEPVAAEPVIDPRDLSVTPGRYIMPLRDHVAAEPAAFMDRHGQCTHPEPCPFHPRIVAHQRQSQDHKKPKAITRYDFTSMGEAVSGEFVEYGAYATAIGNRDMEIAELRAALAAALPSPPDVGREELALAIAKADYGHGEVDAHYRAMADAISAKFHVAKKGHA